jgi:glucose dehydrogenase
MTLFLLALLALPLAAAAEVTSQRLEHAGAEPQNWLMYSGTYNSQRYSGLAQVNKANVKKLELQWVVQDQVPGVWQSNPLVVDGVMYLTQRPNDVMAVDAKTGKHFWVYRWTPDPGSRVCCGSNNRAWRCWATRCSWARWTPISSPSTPRPASRCGTSPSRISRRPIRSPWRPSL